MGRRKEPQEKPVGLIKPSPPPAPPARESLRERVERRGWDLGDTQERIDFLTGQRPVHE